ncbi:Type I restriction modification system specificity subunit HsdS [Mycoplasmopsis californica]|uniref:Type I restriction modification system specificity subunit HsdS n=1 Tax=Mycoplasmopsis californica TaxID=2113 RepID=A0A059XRC1_9BACT|nr:restriction endonuclease subunit S [Mycoplasmopsis californica]AIA29318.1 Type I restriction modification system specificity subunit HsdS [Mycoplasmopsis californica]
MWNLKLNDIAKINSLSLSKKDIISYVKYLDTSNLKSNIIENFQYFEMFKEKLPSRAKRKVKQNTILYSTVRPNQKHFGILKNLDFSSILVSTGFCTIDVDNDIADPDFIYYYITQDFMIKKMQSIAEQSTTSYPSITPNDVKNIEINLPNIEIQRKIGKFLSDIESKIKTNCMINDNLEKQAKLLYDYWFTQFDFPDENGNPYKSSGGEMVWNKQLECSIPEKWEIDPLSAILNFKSGFSFCTDLYVKDGKYKLLTIKNIQDTGINFQVDNYINNVPHNVPDHCFLKVNDILMTLTGNIGRIGILYSSNCLLNQRVALVKNINEELRSFVYYLLKSDIMQKKYQTMANGSSQKNLSPIEAESVLFTYCKQVATNFSSLIDKSLKKIVSNLAENQKLISLRDYLLPLLLNGQSTIED